MRTRVPLWNMGFMHDITSSASPHSPARNLPSRTHAGSTHLSGGHRDAGETAHPDDAQVAVASCSDEALVSDIRDCEAVSRSALARQLDLIAEAERRGLRSRDGARSTQVWLRELLNIAEHDAKTRMIVSRSTTTSTDPSGEQNPPELPSTTELLHHGQLSLAHARVIAEGIAKLPQSVPLEERAELETWLADRGRDLGPKDLRITGDHARYQLDQDGALKDEEYQVRARKLHIVTGGDRMTVLNGRIDRETGAKLRAALQPLAAPQPAIDGAHDPRTPEKRNADALETLLNKTLAGEQTSTEPGERPQITVTIDYDDLRSRLPDNENARPGTLEPGEEPLSPANTRRLACDAEVLPVLLGGQSRPLDVGRARRTAPAHIRTALLARDGQCAFPRCDRPPGLPEAHHIQHWADGGPTSVDNMVMLCGHHHRTVHAQGWGIDLSTGTPAFTPPAGTASGTGADPPPARPTIPSQTRGSGSPHRAFTAPAQLH